MLDMKWTRRHLHHCFDTDCGNHLPALKSNNWNIENISIIIILSFVSNTDQVEVKTGHHQLCWTSMIGIFRFLVKSI